MIQGNHFSFELPLILQKSLLCFQKKNGTMTCVKREHKNPPVQKLCRGYRVINSNTHPQLLLRRDERFNVVLQSYLREHGEEVPKTKDNSLVCPWFHCNRECTKDCVFKDTHGLLLPKVVNNCVSFVAKARNALGST